MSGAAGGIIGSAQTDIVNPYETIPCRCIYCFVCVAQKLEAEEGDGWMCLRCGEIVKRCRPWSGDVLEEVPRSAGGKIVGFAADKEGDMADNFGGDRSHNLLPDRLPSDTTLQESSQWSDVGNLTREEAGAEADTEVGSEDLK